MPRPDHHLRAIGDPFSQPVLRPEFAARKYIVYGLGVFATIAAVWLAATDGGGCSAPMMGWFAAAVAVLCTLFLF